MVDVAITPPLVFVRTMPMPCPYIAGETERRLVTDISTSHGKESHDTLANAGFRRTQHLSYRPACPNCSACKPIRIQIANFNWTKSFRRIKNRNADLLQEWKEAKATDEQFLLFKNYQNLRHTGGDMGLMDYTDFGEMVERSPIETRILEHRKSTNGELVAVMLVDTQNNGYSAVYSFFDGTQPNRSLGTFLVLDLVRKGNLDELQYVYLGYWVENSSKMSYKIKFGPVEVLGSNGWIEHSPSTLID
jgi:arginyl-tRNA--protein-N-Asp/Glu arginylyltransferase